MTTATLAAGNCNSTGALVVGNMQAFRVTCGNTAATTAQVIWPAPYVGGSGVVCAVSATNTAPGAYLALPGNNNLVITWTVSSANTAWDVMCFQR